LAIIEMGKRSKRGVGSRKEGIRHAKRGTGRKEVWHGIAKVARAENEGHSHGLQHRVVVPNLWNNFWVA